MLEAASQWRAVPEEGPLPGPLELAFGSAAFLPTWLHGCDAVVVLGPQIQPMARLSMFVCAHI